ncbi:MAG: hypothetical protein AAF657_24040 [Acidobacteriota bacterium]
MRVALEQQEREQSSKLQALKTVTAASKRDLTRKINRHPDLSACASVIADSQISGGMTVSALGNRVWNNKTICLKALP